MLFLQLGYKCKLLVFIFGSLGNVHRLVVRGLQMAGMLKPKAKALARFYSVSALIGSRHIWRRRCFLYVSMDFFASITIYFQKYLLICEYK